VIIIDSNVVQNSIKHYGFDLLTTVEECSELIQAISKMKRGKDNRNNLIEEMADVMICMEILKQVYGVSDSEIQNYVCKKQDRCVGRMESDESQKVEKGI
jgi:NTP pyrophosphatase (non-canonical NTP hydrolase)